MKNQSAVPAPTPVNVWEKHDGMNEGSEPFEEVLKVIAEEREKQNAMPDERPAVARAAGDDEAWALIRRIANWQTTVWSWKNLSIIDEVVSEARRLVAAAGAAKATKGDGK
jgi:hypothetical protein